MPRPSEFNEAFKAEFIRDMDAAISAMNERERQDFIRWFIARRPLRTIEHQHAFQARSER